MRSEFIIYYNIVIISLAIYTYGQHDPGGRCIIENTQSNGICKPIAECPSVFENMGHAISSHTRCGFRGKMEIVCCPENPMITSPSSVKKSGISAQKCNEYKSAVFKNGEGESAEKCSNTIPHMALIGFHSDDKRILWYCSGILISDEYVLTAAHCLNEESIGEPKYVRLGDFNINSGLIPEYYKVSAFISHPEYNPDLIYNDIGLIKLDRKVKLTPNGRPACLPTTFDNVGNKIIFTGWVLDLQYNVSRIKQYTFKEFSAAECNDTYAPFISPENDISNGIVPDIQICAGLEDETNVDDVGPGSSGGPLQTPHPEYDCMFTVIGVISFSISRDPTIPIIHTRVYHYIDWIESVVWTSNS